MVARDKKEPDRKKTQNRKTSDEWERIERAYRANQLTIKDIADQFNTTPQAINNRAKRYEWKRNLGRRVSEAVHRKVAEEMGGYREGDREYEEALIVEEAAEIGINIIRGHQSILREHFDLASELVLWLKKEKGNIPLKDWTIAHSNAIASLERLIKMDRQTYNLDEGDQDDKAKDMMSEFMDKLSASE